MSKKYRYCVTFHSGDFYEVDANSSRQAKIIVVRGLAGKSFEQVKHWRKAIKHCRIIANQDGAA